MEGGRRTLVLLALLLCVLHPPLLAAEDTTRIVGASYEVTISDPPTTLTIWPTKGGIRVDQYFSFRVTDFRELQGTDEDFTVVRTEDPEAWVWEDSEANSTGVDGSLIQHINFTATMDNGGTFMWQLTYYERENSVYSAVADYEHHIPADSFKFSVEASSWDMDPNTDIIELVIEFYSSIGIAPGGIKHSFGINSWPVHIVTTDDTAAQVKLNFLSYAEVDFQKKFIRWTPSNPLVDTGEEDINSHHTYRHSFKFDTYEHQIFYDPDMTVVFPDKDKGGNDDTVAIGIAVGVSVGAVLLVAPIVVAVGIFFIVRRSHKRRETLAHCDSLQMQV